MDDQKHHSWRFWFRQRDIDPATGQPRERDIRATLAPGGRYIPSYNSNDFALEYWMRVNDAVLRNGDHFNRPLDRAHRVLPGGSTDPERDLNRQPALMWDRQGAVYNHDELNFPAGAVVLDYAGRLNNVNASEFGWHDQSHGHFLYKDRQGMDGSLASIRRWYAEVFGTRGAVPIGNA